MRFLRHLAAVMLVVTVIVAGSFLWAHVDGGSTGGATGPLPQEVLVRIGQIKAGRLPVRPDDGMNFSQYQNLIRTALIETALATVIITIGIARRQHRRAQRVTRGAPRAR
jgi:hypothetical protein